MLLKIGLDRDELDQRLGGGIPSGSLVLVEGAYGAGKSILVQRLLYGLVENGVTVSLVSTELTTLHFVEQMHSLDYTVDEPLLDLRLLFLPVHPILGHRGRRVDLLARLLGARRMYEQDVIIIDAYSSLLKRWIQGVGRDRGLDPAEAVDETLHRFRRLTAAGKTIILSVEPSELPPDIAAVLRAAADIYLSLELTSVGGVVGRAVQVRRFGRAAKPVSDVVPFRVEPQAGLIVEIKSVS